MGRKIGTLKFDFAPSETRSDRPDRPSEHAKAFDPVSETDFPECLGADGGMKHGIDARPIIVQAKGSRLIVS